MEQLSENPIPSSIGCQTEQSAEPIRLILGNCIEELKKLPENSVDSVVCDPPYALGFMGKDFDGAEGFRRSLNKADSRESKLRHLFQEFCHAWAVECLRVLKPGGHLLAFGGTRTYHRMACAVEDAGFEIRDSVMWVYGSGFPKSQDVSKAIDKAAGAQREVIGEKRSGGRAGRSGGDFVGGSSVPLEEAKHVPVTAPSTESAKRFSGFGTALKPAHEPIVVARKPLIGTVAQNVLEHGTGALNIDECRVPHVTVGDGNLALNPHLRTHINGGNGGNIISHEDERRVVTPNQLGRWPANIVFDEEAGAELDKQSGTTKSSPHIRHNGARDVSPAKGADTYHEVSGVKDIGGASRFFYCAKASKRERGEGNNHPTVKPIALMRWLVRLVTPPGGLVVDPFLGSGTTGIAAREEGFRFIGIENNPDYMAIAERRLGCMADFASTGYDRLAPSSAVFPGVL